jgi:FAD/FMN-containing dehydrogenase
VVASALELEPRLNSLHEWNYTDPLRCTEVTWGDGNRMFTGDAGLGPLDLTKQQAAGKWQFSATGPNYLDFYRLLTGAQGTMGIVTWASLKCELLPQAQKLFFVPADSSEDLQDFVYRVLRLRFSDQLFVLNGAALASLVGSTPADVEDLRGLLPAWIALVGVVGRELLPAERVEAQEADIREIAQEFGLKLLSALPGVRAEEALQRILGPTGESSWKETWKGAAQDIFFSTTLDRTAGFIVKMRELASAVGYPATDVGVYLQPTNMGTSCHCEFTLPYDPACPRETARMEKLFVAASEALAGMGAYYSRPYGIWARLQLNKDAQSNIVIKKLKGIFDPNNILNPGKLSI